MSLTTFSTDYKTTSISKSSYLRGRIGWQGLKASEFIEEGPYLITGTDFKSGKIDWKNCYHVTEERYAEAEYIHVRKGDILITKDGTIGKVAFVKDCPPKAVLNSGIFLLRCKDGSYDHRFMFHLLNSHIFVKFLDDNLAGSTIQHLYQHIFERFEFPIPVIKEQTQIATILSTIDRAIEQTEKLIAKQQRIKTGLMQDLLTKGIDENGNIRREETHQFKDSVLGRIPVEWEVEPLLELAKVDRGKFTHRPRNDPRFYGGKYPFIQTGDITSHIGRRVYNYSQTLNKRGTSVSKKFPRNTIAITIAANIADTAILGIPMFFPDSIVGVIVLKPNNTRFVELTIRRWKPILQRLAPQSAQKNINLEVIRPLLIPIPNFEEQQRIADIYEEIESYQECTEQILNKLQSLKTGLMQDLLTGKVRVIELLKETD
ncbi:MAG: restriction endonuclease subunit S [Crocosphaera sp.]|nr:restriction endonuclease subunit S [Crocosphaera sp.]